jgi:hypothetical protein
MPSKGPPEQGGISTISGAESSVAPLGTRRGTAWRWAVVLIPGFILYFIPITSLTADQRHLLAFFISHRHFSHPSSQSRWGSFHPDCDDGSRIDGNAAGTRGAGGFRRSHCLAHFHCISLFASGYGNAAGCESVLCERRRSESIFRTGLPTQAGNFPFRIWRNFPCGRPTARLDLLLYRQRLTGTRGLI